MNSTSNSNAIPFEHATEDRHGLGRTLQELRDYRELFFFLAWRDIKVRYKQTFLGAAWAIIQPLLTMLLFTLLFGRLAGMPSNGLPLPLFYLAALLPWTYVSSTVSTASMSLVGNSNLLTKIYFPRLILPLSSAISGLLDFLVGSLLLIVVMAHYRVPPTWALLLWPALIVLMIMIAASVGVFLAALNVRFRDVKYAVPFAIQLWLFLTPIIYPSSIIPERFRWILALNPLGGVVEMFRYSLDPNLPVHWEQLGFSAATAVVLLILAVAYFKRTERAFADII